LGTFFIKSMREMRKSCSYRDGTKYYFEKLSPSRAFFAVPKNEISSIEEKNFENQFFGFAKNKWEMGWEERKRIDKLMSAAKEKYLSEQKIPRFKILEFAVTSKRIKELILTNQENPLFSSKDQNKKYLLTFLEEQILSAPQFTICNRYGIDEVFFIDDDKNTIEEKGRDFAREKKNITVESECWEDRFKKK